MPSAIHLFVVSTSLVSLLLCSITGVIYLRLAMTLSKELVSLEAACAKGNPMGIPFDIRELKDQRRIVAASRLKWTTFKILVMVTMALIDVVAIITLINHR